MDRLTHADITPDAIDEQRRALVDCDVELSLLQEKIDALQAQVDDVSDRRDRIHKNILWRQLMAEAEAATPTAEGSTSLKAQISEKIDGAVVEFRRSLQEPEGYAEESAADSAGEPVPYVDTDDYADLSALDSVVEDITDDVRDALKAAAALTRAKRSSAASHCTDTGLSPSSVPLSHNSSIASAATGRVSEARSPSPPPLSSPVEHCMAPNEGEYIHQQQRRQALLRLLVLSLYAGRFEAVCGFDSIPDPANAPTDALDDVKETVAATWQWALYETRVLSDAEKAYWRFVVESFLGPPFDSVPSP